MEEKPIGAEGEIDVQTPIEQSEAESPTPVIEQKPKRKKFIILGVILGVLVIVGIAFGAYKLGQRQPQTSPSPTPEAVTTPTPDPTADWEIYTNTKYGFSIRHPKNYTINEYGPSESSSIHVQLKSTETGIDIINIFWLGESPVYNMSLTEWYNDLLTAEMPYTSYGAQTSPEYTERKEIEIGGVKGIQLKQMGEYGVLADILLPLSNVVVEIGIDYDVIEIPEIKQILSTFKFLEDKEWKVYTNESQGISFNYPPDWTVRTDSQNFENGDLFSIYIIGPTQKENTEFYDGAYFTVAIPLSTSATLEEWLDSEGWIQPSEATGELPEITKGLKLGNEEAVQVYICGLGCFTYRFAKHEGEIYGVVYFAEGSQKSQYEENISHILSAFQFLD